MGALPHGRGLWRQSVAFLDWFWSQAVGQDLGAHVVQAQLAAREFDFSRGGGAVQVKVNGAGQTYTTQAVASHSNPGTNRKTAVGASNATNGHCTQPTKGGWSK